ncbi:MAG TPA: serine/threonine-protein kinase, partial [Candidatus Eisenbacteria bacterium]|nr:serine/threonine-protein kinase [Candidatus Eisenbacteria bacterium]
MDADQDRLDALAGSVSDGRAVDWNGEASAADALAQPSVLALRDVARIAEFNRDLQRSPGSGPDGRAPAPPLEPGRWGELVLLEAVGGGASGEVWRAWDPRLQREVALKFLQATGAGETLLDEARALARVRHASVVAVHGIDTRDGRTGMWMEFLRGGTLAAEIERRGALPPAEVAHVGAALAAALAEVHRAGLVHRDLKPANVVLEPGGRVVLTDFGLGQRRDLPEASPRISGTPLFMSPERLDGEPATPRSDLYALGVTLRFALTGRAPFAA